MAVPRLSGSRKKANRSAVLANLRTIESAVMMAEASGVTIEDELNFGQDNPTLGYLEGYLNSIPKGPVDVTYTVNKGVAEVNFNDEDFKEGFNGKSKTLESFENTD